MWIRYFDGKKQFKRARNGSSLYNRRKKKYEEEYIGQRQQIL